MNIYISLIPLTNITDSEKIVVFWTLLSCTFTDRKACLAFLPVVETNRRQTYITREKRIWRRRDAEAGDKDNEGLIELDADGSCSRPQASKAVFSRASGSKGGPHTRSGGISSSDLAEVQYFCTLLIAKSEHPTNLLVSMLLLFVSFQLSRQVSSTMATITEAVIV